MTTGSGDAVKSGAELGKGDAPVTQEAGLSAAKTLKQAAPPHQHSNDLLSRFTPDGKVANKGATAGTGDGVKSGAELGKGDAPVTQEATLSAARTTVGSTPGGNGFASTQSPIGASADAPAARAADASAAQRQFEKDNAPKPPKGRSLADKLNDGARSLQYEANRRKPGLSHDGQSGGVSIRMNHID